MRQALASLLCAAMLAGCASNGPNTTQQQPSTGEQIIMGVLAVPMLLLYSAGKRRDNVRVCYEGDCAHSRTYRHDDTVTIHKYD